MFVCSFTLCLFMVCYLQVQSQLIRWNQNVDKSAYISIAIDTMKNKVQLFVVNG